MKNLILTRKPTGEISGLPVQDGQLIFDKETGDIYEDVGSKRIKNRAEGQIVRFADMNIVSDSYVNWENKSSVGHVQTWSSVRNASDYKKDDLIIVSGIISDKNNTACQWYGIVTSTSVNSVTAKYQGFIFSGDDGKTKVQKMSGNSATISPNIMYIWEQVSSLNITLGKEETGFMSEYMFQFKSGLNPTTLIVPGSVKWVNGLNIEKNKTYQVSILNNIGVIAGV